MAGWRTDRQTNTAMSRMPLEKILDARLSNKFAHLWKEEGEEFHCHAYKSPSVVFLPWLIWIPFTPSLTATTGWSKSFCAPDSYSTVQLMIWRWPSQNTFGMLTVLYWTRSSRTQFGVSINVWKLKGDTLNITRNFLYCNHQVHRDFLITLCKLHLNIIFSSVPRSSKYSFFTLMWRRPVPLAARSKA